MLLADAIGISQGSVSKWGEFPPQLRQLQLEALSGGVLKAERGILPRTEKVSGKSRTYKVSK